MSGLRKKLAEKKGPAGGEGASSPAPSASPGVNATPASANLSSDKGKAQKQPGVPSMRAGFLSRGSLYPDGSGEAAPALWRGGATERVFNLKESEGGYEVVGEFHAAGRFLGKEDFEISRTGLSLHIKGVRHTDPEQPASLVAGLDETIALPPDGDFAAISAEFAEGRLVIRIPRSRELSELLKHLSPSEAQELARKYGIGPSPLLPASSAADDDDDDHHHHHVGDSRDGVGAQHGRPPRPPEPGVDVPIDPMSHEVWASFARAIGLRLTEAESRGDGSSGDTAAAAAGVLRAAEMGARDQARARDQMARDGYCRMSPWASDEASVASGLGSLAHAIDRLRDASLPAQFLLVFDDVWEVRDWP